MATVGVKGLKAILMAGRTQVTLRPRGSPVSMMMLIQVWLQGGHLGCWRHHMYPPHRLAALHQVISYVLWCNRVLKVRQ